MYEMNEHGMFLGAARSGQSLLNQLLTGRVRTMIESSSLSLFFKLSPVTSRPLVQSWFQWGSLKDMPDRNA